MPPEPSPLEIRLRFQGEAHESLVRIILPGHEDSTSATNRSSAPRGETRGDLAASHARIRVGSSQARRGARRLRDRGKSGAASASSEAACGESGNLIKSESLILRATSLGSPAMAERTRRRKARSAGARKATKRARTKGRAARGKTAKPKKKTVRTRKAAAATRTRPSPRRPAKATAPAAKPEAQTPPAGRHPEATAPSTATVQRPGERVQAPASDADDT